MFVPIWLTNAQDVSSGFKIRDVGTLVRRVSDNGEDVNDRLGCQTRNGSRSNMVNREQSLPKRKTNCPSVFFILFWPVRVVRLNANFPFLWSANKSWA